MDQLVDSVEIQRTCLQVIREEYLAPMTNWFDQKEKVTLAEHAQQCRLEKLCEVWEHEFPVEESVVAWYINSKHGRMMPNLVQQLHRPAMAINQESNHLNQFLMNSSLRFDEAMVVIEEKLERDLLRRSVDRRHRFKLSKTAGAISQSMHREDSDTEEEEDEDMPMPNPIELKIATLHDSLERILLATRDLIEMIQRSGENMASSQAIFAGDSDVSKLLLRFPERYIPRSNQ